MTTIKEWTWYQSEEGSERCDADDHTIDVRERIKKGVQKRGIQI
ncbi:MAG: hypothetical protein SVY15_09200 [Halobacteriota archaeon]|nr:hypothetical protein [Halobacteriota archaeon]